jgi:hypothetical protein
MPAAPGILVRPALLVLVALTGLVACATPFTHGTQLDWSKVADIDVIEIVTTDEDGDLRETKVWFVLVDGVSYLRTSDSRWLENIRRDPDVKIRVEGVEYRQKAREVTDEALMERVDAAGREKYGFQDRMIHVLRTSHPQVIELSPPDA